MTDVEDSRPRLSGQAGAPVLHQVRIIRGAAAVLFATAAIVLHLVKPRYKMRAST